MEQVQINLAAFEGLKLDKNRASLLQLAFRDAPEEERELLPIILRIHGSWWADEPERSLAFLMRDNPRLVSHMRRLMGLDTLEWGSGMMEIALDGDNYAQMLLMHFAGETGFEDDILAIFQKALDESRFRCIIFLALNHSKALGLALGATWANAFSSLTEKRHGLDYLAGQVLIGVMKANHPRAFEAGLAQAVQQYQIGNSNASLESIESYLTDMASAFHPDACMRTLFADFVASKWENY